MGILADNDAQCDLNLQGCSQCARQGIVCSGYRKVTGLRVVDQSEETASRVVGQNRNSHRGLVSMSPLSVLSLLPTMEDQASCYFFTRYVPDSHFFYLPGIYSRKELANPLTTCVQAVAVASFANQQSSSTLMRKAMRYYASALRDINAVIKSPTPALLDSTIVAILLLGLFEALVYQNQPMHHNQDNPFTHNQGALALLAMRGPELLRQELGFQVFIQISSSIRVACLQRQKRAPACLLQFHKRAIPFLDPENPKVRFFPIIDEFIELQANIVENHLQYSWEVVHEAARIDLECQHLMSTIHHGQNYAFTISKSEDSWAYGNKIHKYPNGNVAQWWNSMRMTRIFLNNIIIQQLQPPTEVLDSVSDTQQAEIQAVSFATIQAMAAEICASVAQFAHDVEASKAERTLMRSDTAVMGLLSRLFWPLCTVGESKTLPYSMRIFAARCLRFLGIEAGFPQAIEAANMIEKQSFDNANW